MSGWLVVGFVWLGVSCVVSLLVAGVLHVAASDDVIESIEASDLRSPGVAPPASATPVHAA